jgi:hypothetical protein
MPAVNVTERAIRMIDEYREQTEWDLSKKDVASKAIEEFHQRHIADEDGGD